jgi:hypothetical protein
MAMSPGARKSVVACAANQVVQDCITRFARRVGKLAQSMFSSWPRHELAVAHRECRQHQHALVVLRQAAYELGQQLESLRVFLQALDGT